MEQSRIQQTVFSILKAGLWGQEAYPFAVPEDTDWEAVRQELRHQAVSTVSVDVLVKADPRNRAEYLQTAMKNVACYRKLAVVQQRLMALLQAEGIGCVVLKGSAAACYYPRPEYRAMGDIDLLVKPEDYHRAKSVLLGVCRDLEKEDDRHAELELDQVILELHRTFAVLRDKDTGNQLDARLWAALDHVQEQTYQGLRYNQLPWLENGLVLLTHIHQHLFEGLGFRQIIDWMMFVHKELDDERYAGEFAPVARQLGLETLAVTVTRMCQMYLGLGAHITWCKDADEALCCQLMELVWEKGNFGRKQGTDNAKSIRIMNMLRNTSGVFRLLQTYGCNNWEALKKHPWLKPFAWLYQICRYIRAGFGKEKPLRSLIENVRKGNRQNDLLTQLGVSREYQ